MVHALKELSVDEKIMVDIAHAQHAQTKKEK
jgi:hypothetical protein